MALNDAHALTRMAVSAYHQEVRHCLAATGMRTWHEPRICVLSWVWWA